MNLTREYFDEQLGKLASKADLEQHTRSLMAFAEAQTVALAAIIRDTIAEPMQERFDRVEQKLDSANKRVDMAETKLERLEEALHIKF